MSRVYSVALANLAFVATTITEFQSLTVPAGHTWIVRHIAVSTHSYANGEIQWQVGYFGPTIPSSSAVQTSFFASGLLTSGRYVSDWEGRVVLGTGTTLSCEAYWGAAPKASCSMLVTGYDLQ